jgi:hypothetical protein
MKNQSLSVVLVICVTCFAMACTPKIGSEAWCEAIGEKAKGDWTVNEAADFAKHCVLK